jgi:hypothetical protein
VILGSGDRQASILLNEDVECRSGTILHHVELASCNMRSTVSGVRISVEIRRKFGGMGMRALIGGVFEAQQQPVVSVEVTSEGPLLGQEREPTAVSSLSRHLVPGLPVDFVHAVLLAW